MGEKFAFLWNKMSHDWIIFFFCWIEFFQNESDMIACIFHSKTVIIHQTQIPDIVVWFINKECLREK